MNDKSITTLQQKLQDDFGSDGDQWLLTVKHLQMFTAPQPSPVETARLVAALTPQLATQPKTTQRASALQTLLILKAQMRLLQQELWLGSALVMVLGVIVSLTLNTPTTTPQTLPFVFIAPIVAALGVALLYGPGLDPCLEIELATPTSPRTLLLARLTLLFGFDLILALVSSAVLVLIDPQLSLTALILTWLAPMTFLSALAFLLTVLVRAPLVGITVSLVLWGGQILRAFTAQTGISLLAILPNLFAPDLHLWLFGLAVAMGVFAVWVASREEHWLRTLV